MVFCEITVTFDHQNLISSSESKWPFGPILDFLKAFLTYCVHGNGTDNLIT